MTRRIMLRISVTLVVLVFVFAAVFVLVVELYPFNAAKLTVSSSPTVIYDVNGKKYATINGPGSDDLTPEQIPKNLQNALVAVEDHNFWNSSSIDAKGILRAAFVDLWSRQLSQGGSTIPEQLAKIVYLTDKKTFQRKFEQIVLGIQINRHFTKSEILAMYLNRTYLGEGATGVEQAAEVYFGINLKKNPNALTLDQAALLAGLPQAPSGYDPLVNPSAAKKRRNEVLAAMAKYGYISQNTAKKAEAQSLGVHKAHSVSGNIWDTHPLFAQFLFDYCSHNGIDPASLTQGGLKVYTTINPKVQNAISTVFLSSAYQKEFASPVNGQEVPAAAVFVDPSTGGISGAAGSHSKSGVRGLDRAYEYGQPGSSIKPILDYAPALESGKWTPNSILNNTPHDFGGGYTPQNDEANQPAQVTMSYALKMSENVAAVWMLQQIGINTGIQFAENDGLQFTSKDRTSLGIAIGGMQKGVTPVQMAQAYEAFDNQGIQQKAHLITKIVNEDDETTYSFQPSAKRIMSTQTATEMTQMLMGVVSGGTGTGAQVSGWDVAGKTGTVQYDTGLTGNHSSWLRLAWFDGYTPNLVGSIYMGWNNDTNGDSAYHTTGLQSYQCSEIFGDIVKLAEEGISPEHFKSGGSQTKTTASGAVTHLSAIYSQADSGVTLNWQSNVSGKDQFIISRASGANVTNSSSFAQLAQVNSLSYLDLGVQLGKVYTYRVQAVNPSTGSTVGSPAMATVDLTKVTVPNNTVNNTTGNETTNTNPGTNPGNTTNSTTPPPSTGGENQTGTGNTSGMVNSTSGNGNGMGGTQTGAPVSPK